MKGSGTRQWLCRVQKRKGDPGLTSVVRGADAACWASWADAIQMIDLRNPVVTDMVVATVTQEAPPAGPCLAELRGATDRLHREGFWWRPSWRSLREGQRPPELEVGELGQWRHGWQNWSSSVSESHSGRRSCCTVGQLLVGLTYALTLGSTLAQHWARCPTALEYTIPPHLFRTLLL